MTKLLLVIGLVVLVILVIERKTYSKSGPGFIRLVAYVVWAQQ